MEKKRRRLILSYLLPPPKSRLNQLPDDILVLILSKLTMKEAARTSVLSHIWQNLWQYIWVYNDESLNFDPCTDASVNIRPLSYEIKTHLLLHKRFKTQRPMLISWVNRILDLHRAPSVDEFRICFDLDENNGDDIERWIKFANDKSVSKLELNFSQLNGYYTRSHYNYQFSSKLLDSPPNATSLSRPFTSLTSLRLLSVDLTDKVAAYFLSNCHSLEHLSIKGSCSLTSLNATMALKLKYLEIGYCPILKILDISNTNIESVNFHGRSQVYPDLRNLHFLCEVSLCGHWCRSTVGSSFYKVCRSQLRRLKLDLGHSFGKGRIRMYFPKVFPKFRNLKHLEVIVGATHNQNIFCLTSLICATPVLNTFILKVVYAEPPYLTYGNELPNCDWRKKENRTHDCLKVVEFYGWRGYKCDMDIVYYLCKRSVVLEKVIINPKLHSFDKRLDLDEDIGKWARERAKLLQKKYVRPGIEFVIV